MLQSFEARTRPEDGPPRLAALRDAMARAGLDAFLVPRADRFQGEYVAAQDERLAWLTGFTGSAGICAVTAESAGLFVDGRYRVQARAQVADSFTIVPWPKTQPGTWLAARLRDGAKVGFDPWLHTLSEIERAEKDAPKLRFVAVENLVDGVWSDRPGPPEGRATPFPEAIAGRSSGEKREEIASALRAARQRAAVLTLPDSIAWLLNIRGADIPRTPVLHAMAVIDAEGAVQLFTDPAKVAGLDLPVTVAPFDEMEAALTRLDGPVRVDKGSAPHAITRILETAGIEVVHVDDPCSLPKACKTAAEISATREAHLRDGAAMAKFLAWLDAEAPKGTLTEIDVVRALEGFRQATGALRDISFETIAGAGPNGAIVHYRVTEETNRPVRPGDLLLVDSGGQYEDGTTDITRTIAVGLPTDEQRACFTRVLKGMIALSRIRFPKGVSGRDLDALARAALWMAGQDYDHGTGHGVGVYLSVHEGPQRISRLSGVALKAGMILSNEPGYYREGAFGIRIENLIAVENAPPLDGGDDREMLHFDTLTFAPIDRRLVDAALLTGEERAWLDAYHADVLARIGPRVPDAVRAWLRAATAPL